jgi:uncharacterized protein DUF6602
VPPHELETFLKQDLAEIASEYQRIRARSREDPGTAGDEGEEAWAAVLRAWLPDGYQVRVKGRILSAEGEASPQVDIVVLRPGYPKRLLDKKLYLAGGVAAAFECKNTLTAADIRKAWHNASAINSLEGAVGERTPFTELVPSIFFGLLAHGHSWTSPGSDPIVKVTGELQTLTASLPRMRDALSIVCIANLGSWAILRSTYDGPGLGPEFWPARKELLGLTSDEPFSQVQYSIAVSDVQSYELSNPLGVLVANVVSRLAFSDSMLRPLSQYFFAAGMGGQMGVPVIVRRFELANMAEEVRSGLPYRLTNGVAGSEWSMVFAF